MPDDLRSRHRADTRERIIQAVHDVLTEESPAALSVPRVAERAGTSLRTVYRYFPTKAALVDAASRTFEADTHGLANGRPGLATLAGYLEEAYRGFTKALPSVRAQHLTPAGRDLRLARLPRARASVRASVLDEGVDLPDADLTRLVDVIVMLVSSSTYLELVHRMGYDEADAARLAAWATAAVTEKARTEGGVAR